jgi:hypothetical protein
MNRRKFFKRLGALAVAGAAARVGLHKEVAEQIKATPIPTKPPSKWIHKTYGMSIKVKGDKPSFDEMQRIMRELGRSARKRQHDLAMGLFKR